MKLVWKERGHVDYELIFGLLALVILLAAALLHMDRLLARAGYQCGFYRLTGVPCVTCRGTRAFMAAGHMRFGQAFRLNPLAAAVFVAMAAYAAYALAAVVLRARRLRVTGVTRRQLVGALIVVAMLLAANWVYLIKTSPVGP